MSKLSTGSKMVLGGTIAFLIVSFFKWFSWDTPVGDVGVSGWNGIGTLAGIAAIAILVWEGARAMGVDIKLPVSPAMATAFLALALALFAVLRFLMTPGGDFVEDALGRTIWAWLGLILAIVVALGAVLNMQAGGESFQDMKGTLAAGAAAATAAAKNVADEAKQAAETAKDRVEDTADRVEDAADRVEDRVEDVADQAEDRVEDALDGDDDPRT